MQTLPLELASAQWLISIALLAAARFLAASSAQLDDSFSLLTDFLSPGLATVVAAPGAPVARPASVTKMDFEVELAVVIGGLPGQAGLWTQTQPRNLR